MLILITVEQTMNTARGQPQNRRKQFNPNISRTDHPPIKKGHTSNYIKGKNPDSVVQIYADDYQTYEHCVCAINKHYKQTKETLIEYKQVQQIRNQLLFSHLISQRS